MRLFYREFALIVMINNTPNTAEGARVNSSILEKGWYAVLDSVTQDYNWPAGASVTTEHRSILHALPIIAIFLSFFPSCIVPSLHVPQGNGTSLQCDVCEPLQCYHIRGPMHLLLSAFVDCKLCQTRNLDTHHSLFAFALLRCFLCSKLPAFVPDLFLEEIADFSAHCS